MGVSCLPFRALALSPKLLYMTFGFEGWGILQ